MRSPAPPSPCCSSLSATNCTPSPCCSVSRSCCGGPAQLCRVDRRRGGGPPALRDCSADFGLGAPQSRHLLVLIGPCPGRSTLTWPDPHPVHRRPRGPEPAVPPDRRRVPPPPRDTRHATREMLALKGASRSHTSPGARAVCWTLWTGLPLVLLWTGLDLALPTHSHRRCGRSPDRPARHRSRDCAGR